MARWMEPTPEQEAGYREWVASRPECVRVVAERFEPWSLYRLKPTGQRVTVASFGEGEDGRITLTVMVIREFNFTLFDRNVFGIDPDELEPCDLPAAGDVRGAMLTADDVAAHLDDLRLMVRPDLWERNEAGEVVRKRWRTN